MFRKRFVKASWPFILKWIGITLTGSAIGLSLSFYAIPVLGEVIAFAITGLLVGAAQWLLLKKYFNKAAIWILLTGVGYPSALLVLNAIESYTLRGVNIYLSNFLIFLFFSLVISFFQWFAIHKRLKGALFWIPSVVIGWILGRIFIWLVSMLFSSLFLADFWVVLIEQTGMSLIVGIITGITMYILLRKTAPEEQTRLNSIIPLYLVGAFTSLLIIVSLVQGLGYTKIDLLGTTPPPPNESLCPNLPPLECSGDQAYCTELVPFDPDSGPGYLNTPVNGETDENQYRSYLQRELMILVKYAAAKIECTFPDWDRGVVGLIGLGDMSESDGAIPGTSIGAPGHPPGTHENGHDIDIANYRVQDSLPFNPGINDEVNYLGYLCDHTIFGVDVYHCTRPPHLLDPWRTAMFIVYLSEHPRLRVIGVDGQVGLMLEDALDSLVSAGWITSEQRDQLPFYYEQEYTGMGWFRHHHHHMHIGLYKIEDLPSE